MRPPRSPSAAAAVLLVAAALAGCSSDDDGPAAAPASSAAPTTAAPTPSATPTPAPTPTATPTETTTPTAEVSESASPATPSGAVEPTATPTAAATPSVPAPTPTRGANRGLRSARAAVRTAAPRLQSYFDEREYPVDLAQLRSTLTDAGVDLGADNSIGGYALSDDGVQFELCVQHDGGGWATYDTAAGAVGETGATGGCP